MLTRTEVTAVLTGSRPATPVPGPVRRRRWVWPAAVTVLAIPLGLAYLREARAVALIVDGPSFLLQAWDMGHGNPLLHGWMLSHLSFYTTELPQYLLLELVRGLNADVVHEAAAMTYTLLVLGTALVARGTAGGQAGAVRALIAGGILLAPQPGPASQALLSNADHTGTQVALLLLWLILDRARPGWRPVAAAGLLLAWTQVADPLVAYEGVLPLLLVCLIRVYRQRATLRRQPPWYEIALAAAAVASAGAAALAVRVIGAAGGWQVRDTPAVFASVGDFGQNLWVSARAVLQLFGADFSGQPAGLPAIGSLIHLAGLALAGWAVARALRHFGVADLMTQVLAVTVLVLLVAFVARDTPGTGYGDREIACVLVAGALLAGRLLAGPLIRGRHLPAAAAVLACYAVILGGNAVSAQPAPVPQQHLTAWLEAHDLRYGLTDYGDEDVTVLSGETVQLRHIDLHQDRLVLPGWQSCAGWYDHRPHAARFLVLPAGPRSLRAAWYAAATRTFGRPAARYRAGAYQVLVWHRDLLTLTGAPVR